MLRIFDVAVVESGLMLKTFGLALLARNVVHIVIKDYELMQQQKINQLVMLKALRL
jgi:hypothetical protein